jgi:hypothetical protein
MCVCGVAIRVFETYKSCNETFCLLENCMHTLHTVACTLLAHELQAAVLAMDALATKSKTHLDAERS